VDQGELDPVWEGVDLQGAVVGDKRNVSRNLGSGALELIEQKIIGFDVVLKNVTYEREICTNETVDSELVFTCQNETFVRVEVDAEKTGPAIYDKGRAFAIAANNREYLFDTKTGWVCGNKIVLLSKQDGGQNIAGRTLCDVDDEPILDSGESYEIRNVNNGKVIEQRSDVGKI